VERAPDILNLNVEDCDDPVNDMQIYIYSCMDILISNDLCDEIYNDFAFLHDIYKTTFSGNAIKFENMIEKYHRKYDY
jgi:hypothetical protein